MANTLFQMLVDVPRTKTPQTPVVLGLPLSPEHLKNAAALRLKSPTGDCPLTLSPLHVQPMGKQGLKWSLLSFLADGPGTYSLETGPSRPDPLDTLAHKVTLSRSDDGILLNSGRLSVTLPAADGHPGPITRIALDGRTILSSPQQLQFLVEEASTLHGRIHKIETLQDTPLHAHVRIHGDHRTPQGETRLTYHLDVHLWAGDTSLRLDYQFFNLKPGAEKLDVASIRTIFQPSFETQPVTHLFQQHHTHRMRPRMVENPGRVEIAADWSRAVPYVTSRDMLMDELEYPFYLLPQLQQTSPWLGLTSNTGSVYLHLTDMAAMRPARLTALPQQQQLIADLWPAEAGPLTLYQGKARRRSITLAFFTPDQKPSHQSHITHALHLPLYQGRATLSPQDMRRLDVFDIDRTMRQGSHLRMEQFFSDLFNTIHPGTGLLNYGDAVEEGYTRGYSFIAKQPLLPGVTDDIHPMRQDHPNAVDPLSFKTNRYEPAWANNEYDIIHAITIELLRTGNRKLWPVLQAITRHNIEVDFIYYNDDPWQHHGSPAHSAHHVHSSAYPSHLWTQGLIQYYCLTGDKDALDVAIMLGDTIIRNLQHPQRSQDFWGFNREIGWALLSLVQLVEATGLQRFKDHAEKTVNFLATYDRDAQASPVKLSNVDPLDDIHSQIAGAFFGYASMIEAIDRYARITGRDDLDPWLRTILIKVRDAAITMLKQGRELDGLRRMIPHGMAIGYERTGEETFLTLGMLCLEMHLHTLLGIAPSGEYKYTAMVHRSLVRFLKYAQEQGLLDKLEYQFAKDL